MNLVAREEVKISHASWKELDDSLIEDDENRLSDVVSAIKESVGIFSSISLESFDLKLPQKAQEISQFSRALWE